MFPFLGSLPQTTNLVVAFVGGGGVNYQTHWFANRVKLAVLSHSEPLWWEKIGKVANWANLAVPSHHEQLQWEKDWKSCESGEIGHSESF